MRILLLLIAELSRDWKVARLDDGLEC
jgi:hypothetical protein